MSLTPNRWQVEWVDPEGVHRTRMFKIQVNAESFARTVPCAPDHEAEVWPMHAAEKV